MADDDAKDKPGTGKPEDSDAEKLKAEVDRWKRISRENEEKAKANADAAKRLKDLEDSDKSAIEKAESRASAAEKERDEAKGHLLRVTVAAEKGLTPTQAKRLVGSTREELESDADELLETFSKFGRSDPGKGDEDDKDKPAPRDRPKERLSGGGDPTEEPEETDPRKLAARVPRL